VKIVQEVGCVICGQTDRMVPADKKLYALRDVTGTVPSIPLITASILSKKLAESLDALILDVKFGRAAFMQSKADARKLARAMVALGSQCGVNTRAILTDMNTPLGHAAGNWLGVKESVKCLEPHLVGTRSLVSQRFRLDGDAVQRVPSDLRALVIECAAQLLVQAGNAKSLAAARRQAEDCLNSGAPRQKWNEMLVAQGANLNAFKRKLALDHTAAAVIELKASSSSYVSKCDARVIGEVIRDLGGGRLTKESKINHDVGVDRLVKPGEPVKRGAVLARIHAASIPQAESARLRLKLAFGISARPVRTVPLISEIIAL
jgi:thymidine phosphorylase